MKPLVVVNFKTYKQGKKVVELARKLKKVDKNIIVGIQASDILEVVKATGLKVYAQHVDFIKKGRATGYILPEAVKKDGAKGVFLNHSEHKLRFDVLKKTVVRCKKLGLKILIFASSLREALKIKKLRPDYLAVEPPELVAGKISVSKVRPGLIKNIAKKLRYPFLVGAGIKTNEDVKIAMKLGARGIAVSSAITKSTMPGKVLKKLIS
jgi:triosephosphate isomerase